MEGETMKHSGRTPGQTTNREPATKAEYFLILSQLVEHWRLMIELFWETGIRTSEALTIVKTDIENHGVWVTIEKRNDRPRVFIKMSDGLYYRLKTYANYRKTERVWPFTPEAVWWAVKKAAKAAGLRDTIHPHSFRHSFGNRVVNTDLGAKTTMANLILAQELMHHKDFNSTLAYLNPTQADVDVARDKMLDDI
jgi:integrase